jgi:3-hydroxyacyl-CoA dehydrogenase
MVVEEGVASPEDVDGMWQIFTAAGIPPFRLMDRVGLDVVLNIEEHYAWVRPGLPEGPRKLLREYADVASMMSRAERRRTPRGTATSAQPWLSGLRYARAVPRSGTSQVHLRRLPVGEREKRSCRDGSITSFDPTSTH